MTSTQDYVWFSDADTNDVRELYRLTKALLTLRDMFAGAYGRAVFSLLAEGTKARLESQAIGGGTVRSADPILDDASDVLDELFHARETQRVDAILAEGLTTSADGLARLLMLRYERKPS